MATDMLLILDVHDKINGSRIAKRDIDAIINDVIVLEPREPESHGEQHRYLDALVSPCFRESLLQ